MVQRRFIYKGNYRQSGGSIGALLGSLFKTVVPRLAQGARIAARNPILRKTVKSAGKELLKTGLTAIDAASKGQKVSPAVKKQLNVAKKRVAKAALGMNGSNGKKKHKCPPKKVIKKKPKKKNRKSRSLFEL